MALNNNKKYYNLIPFYALGNALKETLVIANMVFK